MIPCPDPSPILLLGAGNILMRDEGLGVRALELFRQRYRLPAGVEAVDGGVMGLDLLPYLEGRQVLVILDAIQTRDPPGTLIRLEGDGLPQALALKMSMHQTGLQEVLAVASLKGSAPKRVIALGLAPEVVSPGVELSETVSRRLPDLVEAAVEELARLAAAPALDGLTHNT